MSILKNFLKTFEEITYYENFSSLNGFFQRIDPRVKFLSSFSMILIAAMIRTITPLIVLIAFTFILCYASKIPIKYFITRTLFIPFFTALIVLPLPFITPGTVITEIGYNQFIIFITIEGINRALQFILRIWACVSPLILLASTTKFSTLIHVMESFKVPKVFIMILSITHRFIFQFLNEAYRMVLAREARTVVKESRLKYMKSLANMISTLFIRAHERGERVYLAMLSRGYSGRIRTLNTMKIAGRDIFFGYSISLICLTVIFIEYLNQGLFWGFS